MEYHLGHFLRATGNLALGRQKWKDCYKFEVNLIYIAETHLKNKAKLKRKSVTFRESIKKTPLFLTSYNIQSRTLIHLSIYEGIAVSCLIFLFMGSWTPTASIQIDCWIKTRAGESPASSTRVSSLVTLGWCKSSCVDVSPYPSVQKSWLHIRQVSNWHCGEMAVWTWQDPSSQNSCNVLR